MVWVIYVSTCDVLNMTYQTVSYITSLYSLKKKVFVFFAFLYPETIHQQAVNFDGDRSAQYSDGHYDF